MASRERTPGELAKEDPPVDHALGLTDSWQLFRPPSRKGT